MRLSRKGDTTVIDEGAKAYRFKDQVTVTGTKESKFMKPGKKYKLHRLVAQHVIATKKAVAVMMVMFFLSLALHASAQLDTLKTTFGGSTASVTNTNSQVKRMFSKKYNGNGGDFSINVNVRSTGGYLRGTVTPIGSLDGLHYDPVGTDSWVPSATDTCHTFDITDKKRLYYGYQFTSDTTQVTTSWGFLIPR